MKNDKLKQLKKEYTNIPIPSELDFVVRKALNENGINTMNQKNNFKSVKLVSASIAAAVIVSFTLSINVSPVFAKALSEIPVVKNIVKVLTFREYTVNEDMYKAEIKTPVVQGLKNEDLVNSLNEKYISENKELYKQFVTDMEKLKGNGGGHLGVDSGYVIKTDTDNLLSIVRYVVNTVGSSSTVMKIDTIDKKKEILITLPSLFKDDKYINIISDNIKKQMIEQFNTDKNKFYWVAGIEQKGSMVLFEKISREQNFYINAEGKLVISFNKYEVAPGYMGLVEFIIPTEILSESLVSSDYIK